MINRIFSFFLVGRMLAGFKSTTCSGTSQQGNALLRTFLVNSLLAVLAAVIRELTRNASSLSIPC